MQQVGAVVVYGIVILIMLYGFWAAHTYNASRTVAVNTPTMTVPIPTIESPCDFNETGILFFTPNNMMKSVPYILYYGEHGEPHTKALTLTQNVWAKIALERYAYKYIHVSGVTVNEHVDVISLQPAS